MPQVLEFTYNENPAAGYSGPPRRAFEQLRRRLLALPGPPALVMLHHYRWGRWGAGGWLGGWAGCRAGWLVMADPGARCKWGAHPVSQNTQ